MRRAVPGDHHQQLCPGALPYRRGVLCRQGEALCGLAGQLARGWPTNRGAVKVAGSLPPLFGSIVRTLIRPSG